MGRNSCRSFSQLRLRSGYIDPTIRRSWARCHADFSLQGKNYAQFPDRNAFRISMADLRKTEVRERLRRVWDDPLSLDPTKHAAEVTEDIAAVADWTDDQTRTMQKALEEQYPKLTVVRKLTREERRRRNHRTAPPQRPSTLLPSICHAARKWPEGVSRLPGARAHRPIGDPRCRQGSPCGVEQRAE